ncbi:putative ORFan [Tupanvirus deep ocean]|uniref:ORFan n=2 Tax=Tupanvirus TaxID=2094720 RepID=A0AC62A7X2_9VIRU|nr:putative ORFan [Tupanvirus deep ocean]QKU33834.1 putative ORFan [Tupanvirus deep ocean]
MGLFCCKIEKEVTEEKYIYPNDKPYTYPIDEPFFYKKQPIRENISYDRYSGEYFV